MKFTQPEQPTAAGQTHARCAPIGEARTPSLANDMSPARFSERPSRAEQFDGLWRDLDGRPELATADIDRDLAYDMTAAADVRAALDVARGPAQVRRPYGEDFRLSFNYRFGSRGTVSVGAGILDIGSSLRRYRSARRRNMTLGAERHMTGSDHVIK